MTPERGDVWLAALDPVAPGEQGGTRPVPPQVDGFSVVGG